MCGHTEYEHSKNARAQAGHPTPTACGRRRAHNAYEFTLRHFLHKHAENARAQAGHPTPTACGRRRAVVSTHGYGKHAPAAAAAAAAACVPCASCHLPHSGDIGVHLGLCVCECDWVCECNWVGVGVGVCLTVGFGVGVGVGEFMCLGACTCIVRCKHACELKTFCSVCEWFLSL